MPGEIPLKIRVDTRDLWDVENSAVNSAGQRLATTLGHRFQLQPKWVLLWEELKDTYSDKATFIPTISRITVAWYDQFLSRLESDDYSDWSDKLLDLLAKKGGDKFLRIEPGTASLKRPSFKWHAPSNSFVLQIPKGDPGPHAKMITGFDNDFNALIAPEGAPQPSVIEEGWDDVATALPTQQAGSTSTVTSTATTRSTNVAYNTFTPPNQNQTTRRIPKITEIDRPAQLFSTLTPSVLTLNVGHNKMEVQCSHEPTLELISSYFTKWGAQNRYDSMSRNVWKVELVESTMCTGVMDTINIDTYAGQRQPNPTHLLAFIEGVLGYSVSYTNGSTWVFKSYAIMTA